MAVVWLFVFLIILTLLPINYHLSKVFLVLKILTVISLLLPVLVVWLLSPRFVDPATPGVEYAPDIFWSAMFMSIACIGGVACAWLIGYFYWLYAKKTNLFEIASWQLSLMVIVAIASWFGVIYLAVRTFIL